MRTWLPSIRSLVKDKTHHKMLIDTIGRVIRGGLKQPKGVNTCEIWLRDLTFSPVEDADLVRPRLMFKRFVLVFFYFVRPNVNEPMALPVEDADVEIAPHHNPFFSPKLLNWNWDDVIVVPSDDDEPIPLPVEDADVEIGIKSQESFIACPISAHASSDPLSAFSEVGGSILVGHLLTPRNLESCNGEKAQSD
ncbi:hypothetical protein Tco_0098199 [Tanacetum coccineum]